MTERQLQVWTAWFDLELERPSRADYYAMQIASEVKMHRLNKACDVNSMRLKRKEKVKVDPLVAAKLSRSRWFALTGYGKRT